MERALLDQGLDLPSATLDQMEQAWNATKRPHGG
jgi:hypothetical protein